MLERYFFSVEDHVEDPTLRDADEHDIDTDELRRRTVGLLESAAAGTANLEAARAIHEHGTA